MVGLSSALKLQAAPPSFAQQLVGSRSVASPWWSSDRGPGAAATISCIVQMIIKI